MIFAYRNVDSPDGDFGLVKQEGDERFVVLTVEEYAALRETEARANTAKVAADLMRARAERAEAAVEAAYRDGYGDGYKDGANDEQGSDVDGAWKYSDTKAALGRERA